MTTATNQETRALSNLEYDLLTALQPKAEAVKAYDTYINDAEEMSSQPCVELFRKLRDGDPKTTREIRHHLQEVMQKGSL